MRRIFRTVCDYPGGGTLRAAVDPSTGESVADVVATGEECLGSPPSGAGRSFLRELRAAG